MFYFQSSRLFFTLFFSLTFSVFYAQISVKNTPNWVVQQSYETDPQIDADEISFGLLTLLNDEQIHIPKQERYQRFVKKITDNVGVQDGSNISINYDPSYQTLNFHQIKVIRNGKIIDKLNINDFQTIRQESSAESYIYDGSLNAMANLSDIRNGDVIDFSYTIKGFNPIHGNHFAGGTSLNDFQPVGKINFRVITKKKLYYKLVNSDIEPTIGRYNSYTTYNWQSTLTDIPLFEDNMPVWHFAYQTLFVSDFESWGEVVDWALSIYSDNVKFSNELQAKIDTINANSYSEGQRIASTLKFVQEDIRYLGLESGIGAYEPFSPSKVFDQRFGDCKDKSWLMVSMLRNMGIEAYPVLVNSTFGESLDQFLPSAKVFDHVVVKVVDSSKQEFFYDPTISNQFGNYNSISFPNYGKALVVKKGVNTLEQIKTEQEDLVEVFDIFDLPFVDGHGTLNTTTVYHNLSADGMRNRYKSSSLSSISKEFKAYYDGFYDGVEVTEDPIFDDDTIDNRVIVEESYKIKEIWQPMVEDNNKLAVLFSPYSIFDVAISPDNIERKKPFALYYPAHKKHSITIKLPERWGRLEKDDITIDSDFFKFRMTSKMNPSRDILYLYYEYKSKVDHVNPEDFQDYYKKIKEMEEIISYYIFIPKSEANRTAFGKNYEDQYTTSSFVDSLIWALGLLALIVVGVVIFFIITRDRKS